MVRRSSTIKHVTGTKLAARTLSFSDLQSLATPCLTWCHGLPSPASTGHDVAHVFRSQQLRKAANDVFPYSCHTLFSESLVTEFERFLRERSKSIPDANKMSSEEVRQELQRRQSLLLTDWSASLFDGALTPETNGFIDDNGMPPWDTWICLLQATDSKGIACLLSWIPSWLAEKVDLAVRADAANSLSWLVVREDGKLQLHGWGKGWEESIKSTPSQHSQAEVQRPRTLPIAQNPDFSALEEYADSVLGPKGYKLLQRVGSSSWTDPRITPVDASVRFKLCNCKEGKFFGAREEWAKNLVLPLNRIGSQSIALGSSGVLFRGDYVMNTPEGHQRIGEIAAQFPSAGSTRRGN